MSRPKAERLMDFHPAANIFPLLEGDELQALKADIAEHGQLDPIWIYQDQILDGRNRYRACQELNIDTATKAWSGTDPLKFVLSMNLHRRHLSAGQRAFVAVEVEKYLAVQAKERQLSTLKQGVSRGGNITTTEQGKARDQAGKQVGVSGKYVSDAKRIVKVAPELAEKVMSGEINIPQAKAQIKSKQKKTAKQRAQEISGLTAEGNNSAQIGALIGLSAKRVRKLARMHDIPIPGDVNPGKISPNFKPERIIDETCFALAGCVMGLRYIQNKWEQITPGKAQIWADEISTSLRSINSLYRKLRRIANG